MVDITYIPDGDTNWGAKQRTNTANLKEAVEAAYSKPTNGIPVADLSSAVAASLGKADTALQPNTQAFVRKSELRVNVRDFGDFTDTTADAAPAINAAIAALSGPGEIFLPVSSFGAVAYQIKSDVNLTKERISIVGAGVRLVFANNAAINVGSEATFGVNFFSSISGLDCYRAGTNGGSAIPADSAFIRLRGVRRFDIFHNKFEGADKAIYVPPMASATSHVCGIIHIYNNEFTEVNYAVYGAVTASDWTVMNDWSVHDNVINRFYSTCFHWDSLDGVMLERNVTFSLSYNSTNPNKSRLLHAVYIGTCDWIAIRNNQFFGSGPELVKIVGARSVLVSDNHMPWPSILTPADTIYIESQTGYFASVVVTDNNIVFYTKSAVRLVGTFGKVSIDSPAATYEATAYTYIGSTPLSSVPHYRYDLGDVTGLKGSQMSLTSSTTGRTGEIDKLPGKTYTNRAELHAPFAGQSTASRSITVAGTATVFSLTDITDTATEYGGLLLVNVKSGTGYSAAAKVSTYLLLVSQGGNGVTTIASDGYTAGAAAGDPSFTFSKSGNTLRATPVGATTGGFVFSVSSVGNISVG